MWRKWATVRGGVNNSTVDGDLVVVISMRKAVEEKKKKKKKRKDVKGMGL